MISQDSISEILRYHHEKPVEIPEDITDPYRQLEYAFRPSGLMMREAALDKGWQKKAYGIMLGYLKDTGRAVTLVPGTVSGYYFKDPETGKKRRVNRKTAELFSRDALCFYRPLPRKKLGIPDLLLYMKQCISNGDLLLIVIASLAVVLIGMLEPRIYNLLTGTVLKMKQIHLLIGVGSFLLASAFASIILNLIKSLLIERINTKMCQAVESSVMMRLLSLPVSFFRKYSSGELSSRVGSVNTLCSMIIQNVLSLGIGGLMSLLYITQIFQFAPALVLPAILTIVATFAISTIASLLQIRVSRQQMKYSAEENGMNYSILPGIQKIKLTGHIELNHIAFRYDEDSPYIFKDLSLTVEPGDYVAIVGRTGCGKSTLVRLLLGFEKPEKGSVFYDHYNLSNTDPVSIRKQTGVVTQNGQLLSGDIFSNITISAPSLTQDEAWEAAEIAGIADDIRKMPMGMYTMISEGQGGISGGQKQRIMIARAIAPKPKILIFDEATSALDNKTQKQVSEALDRMNCTRIVIAHRLSTIRNCSRILMLHDGEIIEEGTYDELIRLNGEFAEMVARQQI